MKNPWDVKKNKQENKVVDNSDKSVDELEKIVFANFKQNNQNKNAENWKHLVFVGFLILLCLWLITGFYQVNSNEVAIVSYLGKYYETTINGVHFFAPYPFGKVQKVNVKKINKDNFTFSTNKRKNTIENFIMTNDEKIVNVDFDIQWKVADAKNYLFNIKDPDLMLKNLAESVLREEISKNKLEDIWENKKINIAEIVKNKLQKTINSYNSGIEIVSVNLSNIVLPSDVLETFNNINNAKIDNEKRIKEAQESKEEALIKAKNEAEIIIQDAENYKKMSVLEAEAEVARFNKVYDSYKNNKESAKKIIYLNTMEEVLKNNNKIIIDEKVKNNFIQLEK